MRSLLILSVLVIAFSAQAESGPEPDKSIWYKCRKDSDCVSANGACGLESINKKFKIEFEEHGKKIAPYVDCMPIDKRVRKPICIKMTCAFK